MNLENIIKKVNEGNILNSSEMEILMENMLQGKLTDSQIGACLIGLKVRGETVEEVATAARVLNRNKITFQPKSEQPIVDTCGTGGDGKSTINISTAVSVILSAMDTKVVKHGNVAQSGKVGSANILEEFGVPLNFEEKEAEEYFNDNNFIFLFAPAFHPTLKHVGKVRKELKVPTLFNYLGPLLNPADPDYQVIGFNNLDRLEFYAKVILNLERKNVAVYTSKDGYDEISSNAPTDVYLINTDADFHEFSPVEIKKGLKKFTIEPKKFFDSFEMPIVKSSDDAKEKFSSALKGSNRNYSNLLAINAALILTLMNKKPMQDNFKDALETILSQKAYSKLNSLKR
jgi:anthranilate phosphoribosyltransferase